MVRGRLNSLEAESCFWVALVLIIDLELNLNLNHLIILGRQRLSNPLSVAFKPVKSSLKHKSILALKAAALAGTAAGTCKSKKQLFFFAFSYILLELLKNQA